MQSNRGACANGVCWRRDLFRILFAICALVAFGGTGLADPLEIKIGYLHQAPRKSGYR